MAYQANPISGGWTEDEKKKALANLLFFAPTPQRAARLRRCQAIFIKGSQLMTGRDGVAGFIPGFQAACVDTSYVCRLRGHHRHAIPGTQEHCLSRAEPADDLDRLLDFRVTVLRPATNQALADPLRRLVEDYRRARGLDRKLARGRLVAEARRLVPGILRAYRG